MLIKKMYDTLYPYKGITHNRIITRGFIFNENGEVLLHYIAKDDEFGHREGLETPGGGKKRFESFHHSIKREIKEETGYDIKIIKLASIISDYYNKIKRHNINFYYVCIAKTKGETSLEEYEKKLFISTKFYSVDEAINLYNTINSTNKVGILIKNRELDSLKKAYSIFKEYKNRRS